MPELTEAGQSLMNALTVETPPPANKAGDSFVTPIADKGPRGLPKETMVRPDPVDPETGQPLGRESDESQLDLKQLYKTKVHVDLGDGESTAVTVGELKDKYSELLGAKELASKNDAERDEFAREQMLARQELDTMAALLPPHMQTDEFRAEARERIRAHVQAETVKLLRILPEWSDPQHAADDRRLINKHAARYGFSADEIGMISDHRMVKYLLDNARAEMRLEGVQAKQAEHKGMKPTPKAGARSKADILADLKKAAADGTMTQRAAAGQVILQALNRG